MLRILGYVDEHLTCMCQVAEYLSNSTGVSNKYVSFVEMSILHRKNSICGGIFGSVCTWTWRGCWKCILLPFEVRIQVQLQWTNEFGLKINWRCEISHTSVRWIKEFFTFEKTKFQKITKPDIRPIWRVLVHCILADKAGNGSWQPNSTPTEVPEQDS